MKHYIGTRFNLKVEEWKTTKSGKKALSEEWLKNRFQLFEDYCLPSFKKQSNQNFIWCVFFDEDTPEVYKEKINLISKDFLNFHPIFIESIKHLNKTFIEYIYSHNENSDKYVITTRVDNDDIIHKDFIKTIQELFQPIDKTVIDLKEGYQLTLNVNKPILLRYPHPFNAFLSVIENVENVTSVYSKMHYDWKSSKHVISYSKIRLWIELVHEENKINDTLAYLKKPYLFNNQNFVLGSELDFRNPFFKVLAYNLISNFKLKHKKQSKYLKALRKLPKRIIRYIKKRYNNKVSNC